MIVSSKIPAVCIDGPPPWTDPPCPYQAGLRGILRIRTLEAPGGISTSMRYLPWEVRLYGRSVNEVYSLRDYLISARIDLLSSDDRKQENHADDLLWQIPDSTPASFAIEVACASRTSERSTEESDVTEVGAESGEGFTMAKPPTRNEGSQSPGDDSTVSLCTSSERGNMPPHSS